MGRAQWLWITVLVAVLGGLLMLFVTALGAGDTSVGNSSSPFIAGYVTILGVPLLVGLSAYMTARKSDIRRGRALVVAALVPPAMLVAITGVFWPVISLSGS